MTALLVNAFYLQEEAARSLRRGEPSARVLDEVLLKAKRLGGSLIRLHANNAEPHKHGDSAMRLGPREDDAIGWQGLDLVLARATHHGLRAVLVLGNQWDEIGGARQYVRWAGLPRPRPADARFFTDPRTIALFESHVAQTLDRVSSLDGHRYGAHPAIAGWELLNEPRGEGLDRAGHAVREWLDRLARLVRARASSAQWLTSGEEGLDVDAGDRDSAFWRRAGASWLFRTSTSFRLNARSPWIDHPSIHVYPETWGVEVAHLEEAGVRMIRESAAIARAHGKRLLVGELGVRRSPAQGALLPSIVRRRAVMRRWLDVAREVDAIAVGPWMLAHDARPPSWDDYQFYLRDDRPLDHEDNGVAPAIVAWSRQGASRG
ncbi:MAG: glycosyl hydrolase [Sandaracinaceae bacterium]|nr:glycosyl hydrolase [Sandaracinaceae bacterium]